jgi:uncharacterized protein with von Willebrand factor type A (vWA) domain
MTSFLERMKSRMSGTYRPTYDPAAAKQKARQSIVTNRFDDRVWATVRKTDTIDKVISDLSNGDIHRGGERQPFEPAPELTRDLFMALYKAVPTLQAKRNLDKEVYPAYSIIKEMIENPRLIELQDMTASDPAMSTIAVKAMHETIVEILSRMPQPGDLPVDSDDDGDDDGEGPTVKLPRDGEGEGDEGGPENDQEFDPDSEDAENQEETDWQKAFDELLKDIDLDRAVNKALDAAYDEVEELDDVRTGFGVEDGEWRTMSPDERLRLAARLNTPAMKELSQIIGRMRRFALGVKATRVVDVPHEAFDVETGNDVRHLLKSEFALLATPETSYEFYRRYVERELLQFKLRGKEEVGRGPIVIAIDKSGSMSGQPFHWAMAVAEALRRFASDEDRDYYAMFFGSNRDRNRFDFPKGKGPFEKVMTFLSVDANGGTEFDGVLTEALEKASKSFDGEGKGKADIVFITDGQSYLSDEWIEAFNKERERVGVRVYSVYIGGAYDMRGAGGPASLLERVSDVVIPVSDLRPEAAQKIFERV